VPVCAQRGAFALRRSGTGSIGCRIPNDFRKRSAPLGGVELLEVPGEAMREPIMILLDTNVVSELSRQPWSTIGSVARLPRACSSRRSPRLELHYGIASLPEGPRQRQLLAQAEAMLAEDFAGRTLSFDSAAPIAHAPIAAARRLSGRPISHADAQIAAIAASRGAVIATRNMGAALPHWTWNRSDCLVPASLCLRREESA
jgi:toxin FitB